MLLLIFLLSLPLLVVCENGTEFLEETSDCVKDLTPSHSPQFSLNSGTFEDFVKYNDFFIDRTLLLKEIFRANPSFMTIFYLPRKFSKSTNLQMIRTFAEIKLDSNYTRLPPNDTFAYNFFARGKINHENDVVELLKKPPMISHHSDLINSHLGQYPVIYLNLSFIQAIDYDSTWNCLKDRIGSEFKRYWFLQSRVNPSNESSLFLKLVQYFNKMDGIRDQQRIYHLTSSMECLAKLVGEFFNQKPILMIDEYDSYIDSVLHEYYISRTEDDKVMKFFARFNALFGKKDLWQRVIVTGTYSIYKTSLDSIPVSKKIYHALANNISYFFGFTDRDVRSLAEHFRIPNDELEQGIDYYKGYQMGSHYPIYNPWSILKYFQTKQLENHWEQTFKNLNFLKALFNIDKMRSVWMGLLGDRTRCASYLYIIYSESDMWYLKSILATKNRLNALSPKKFTQTLMYMADAGHMTWMKYREPDPSRTFNVWLPNKDTKRATFFRMRAAYTTFLKVKTTLADDAALKLHSYLSSDRPGQLFVEVMTTFERLYNKTGALFETDRRFREPVPKQKARDIADYIGLRIRYQYDYEADPMFMSGFLLRKSNASFVVIFNYNQSVESGQVLERVRNYVHPWTTLKPETTMVKYVVISVGNDTDTHMLSYTSNYIPNDTIATSNTSSGDMKSNIIETTVVHLPSTEVSISSTIDSSPIVESTPPLPIIEDHINTSSSAVENQSSLSDSENNTVISQISPSPNEIQTLEAESTNHTTITTILGYVPVSCDIPP
ncbi:uncharacterized protein LOC135837939 [Planococcus citri]|uniref:uncharacterized protein LOC135837939 n=1 Tax=Planococcus citri TaxID=170843 RepID=UPI0031F950A0